MKFFSAIFLLSSVVAKTADTNDLPALAPAYREIPPTFFELHETDMIIGGFALLAFAFLFLKVMLRPESKLVLPPEVLAREALVKLQRQPEDGKLLSEVSQILRRYLIAAFELPPAELTTAEFCAALAGHNKIGTELGQSISNFLRECDERKFSPANPKTPFGAPARALEIVQLVGRASARAESKPNGSSAASPHQSQK